MAKNYNDIYTAVYTKGNKMDFGNSMIRGNGIPLDITAVYNSLSAAEAYVNSNPVAYEGQVLAVTENNDTVVYVIAARLGEDGVTVEHYLKEVGSAPAVDGTTIKIVDGKLTAVIPEYEDTDTTYTLSVLADGKIKFISDKEGAEATEISFVGAQGIAVTSNAETGVITFTGPDLSGLATKTELANKANSADVYTRTETDTKIGEAIAAADHLKRVILDAPVEGEDVEDVINQWLIDNKATAIADQYIYMIPTGLSVNDNKYYEYIIIIDGDNSYIEQVGNWEVDLSDYLKSTDAEDIYVKKANLDLTPYAKLEDVAKDYVAKTDLETNYSTSTQIAETYVSKNGLTTTLADYAKSSEIPTDYVSDSEFETAMTEYDKSSVADGKYAPKQDTADGLANRYTKEETNSLLANKVNTSVATAEDGLRFINQIEINKLSKLNLEGDDITISGSVNASQVKELYPTVVNIIKGSASDLDPDIDGNQLGLGIEEGAQVNKIDSVSTEFTITTAKELQIVSISAEKVGDLSTWIETNRNTVSGLYPVADAELLANLNTVISAETTGILPRTIVLETKVGNLEDLVTEHTDKISALEIALTWGTLKEAE